MSDSVRSILVVDDQQMFRNAAVEAITPILPIGWEVIAPRTLVEALKCLTGCQIRVALIDKSIGDPSYQESDGDGAGSYRGWQVANYIKINFPEIRMISYSRANFSELADYMNVMFTKKLQLNSPNIVEKDEAIRELQALVLNFCNEAV